MVRRPLGGRHRGRGEQQASGRHGGEGGGGAGAAGGISHRADDRKAGGAIGPMRATAVPAAAALAGRRSALGLPL
jgi:hypothetical protein